MMRDDDMNAAEEFDARMAAGTPVQLTFCANKPIVLDWPECQEPEPGG